MKEVNSSLWPLKERAGLMAHEAIRNQKSP